MKYGLPYIGSKNKLAVRILDCLPRGGTLVDLFCGGCAVSHAAMCLGRYDHIIINDRDWRCPTLFMDALQGKFKDERRWISREDFHRLKATDPYVAFVWSFGNNLRNYLYGEDIEPFKRAIHYAIYFDDVKPARAFSLDLGWVLSIQGERQRYLAIKHYLQRGGAGVPFPIQEASGCNTANDTAACRTEQMQHVITRSVSKILGGHFQQQSLEGKVQVMQIAALRSLIAMGGGSNRLCDPKTHFQHEPLCRKMLIMELCQTTLGATAHRSRSSTRCAGIPETGGGKSTLFQWITAMSIFPTRPSCIATRRIRVRRSMTSIRPSTTMPSTTGAGSRHGRCSSASTICRATASAVWRSSTTAAHSRRKTITPSWSGCLCRAISTM